MGRENVGHSESYAETHSTYQTYFRRMLCRKKEISGSGRRIEYQRKCSKEAYVKALQTIRKECLINHKEGV